MGVFNKKSKEKNGKKVSVPEIWIKRGVKDPQQVVNEINKAYDNKERLGSNIYVGTADCGNICIIVDSETRKCQDAYPVSISSDNYLFIKNKVKESQLGEPDDFHHEVVSLAIAIDYIGNLDLFNNKEDIVNNRYALFDSSFVDDMIIIRINGYGKIAIGYDSVKEIIEQVINSFK